ncbi:MAG TPA: hypothetical protein PKM34_10720, partial [Bacteroidales bacterium]|nr:hypothetical protein [Bacteroidales bacterium]
MWNNSALISAPTTKAVGSEQVKKMKRLSQKSIYSLFKGSPTTEAVGSNPNKTFGTNGFSRWSTNCLQVIKSKCQIFETPSL